MSRNRTLGAPYELCGVTASFNTEPHVDRYLVSTPGIGPAVVVTLDPSAQDGDQVVIQDAAGNAETFPITVVGTIILGEDTIDVNGGSVEYTFSFGLGGWVTRASDDADTSAAFGNYVTITGAAPTNTPAAPTAYVNAAIIVTPQVSGIFRVDVSLGYFDTVAENVTWALLAAEATGSAITLTDGAAAAQIGSTAGASAAGQIGTGTPGIQIAGIGAFKILDSKVIPAIAGLESNQAQLYQADGIFSFSTGGASKIPFTLGKPAVFYVVCTAAAGLIEGMKLIFSVQEQPIV